MTAAHGWFRASRHRTRRAALERRAELVRAGFRPREVRVQRVDEQPFRFAIQVRRDMPGGGVA